MNRRKLFDFFLGGGGFDITTIQSKFAGWWKDEESTYITDQLGYQDRTILTQNSQAGVNHPGRAYAILDGSDYAFGPASSAQDVGTAPFSISFRLRFPTVTGFVRYLGKYIDGLTQGEYYFSTGGSSNLVFNWRTTAGAFSANVITGISTNTWYHIVVTIQASSVQVYVNNVQVGGSTAFTGTFPSTSLRFFLGGYFTGVSGGAHYHDLRFFKGKLLSSTERTTLYNGGYVSGFTDWIPLENSYVAATTVMQSADNGGGHFSAASCVSGNFITGQWHSIYNNHGYANDASLGLIPPDMTDLVDGIPQTDCYGNALVFKGSAKLHLEKSGANYIMFDDAIGEQTVTLQQACRLISLNTWWSSNTSQSIAASATATYCGSRQFYNSTTKELIIIKKGEHLTAREEAGLMSYLQNPSTSHSYDTATDSLFALFTNSYTDAQKSRIDNVIRLLKAYNVWAKTDVLYIPALPYEEEQVLNWKANAAFNLTNTEQQTCVDTVFGIAGNTSPWQTGWDAVNNAVNYSQNSAFISFKVKDNQDIPSPGYITYPLTEAGMFFTSNANGRILSVNINCNISGAYVAVTDISRTHVVNRSSSTALQVYFNGLSTTTTSTSKALTSNDIQLGQVQLQNYIQHLAWGASLSATEAQNLALVIDNFCDGQLASANSYIQADGFRYWLEENCYFDRHGDEVIWSDNTNLYYSSDGGQTVSASVAFNQNTLGFIHMGHIFDNGKIIFATSKNKVYKTTTAMGTPVEITPQKWNGSSWATYTPHTPANANFPGEYFKQLGHNQKQYLDDGTEIYVWGAYSVSQQGAAPTHVWFSFGDECKSAYEFGQNAFIRDNGTNGGGTTGTLLGDPASTIYVRHAHDVVQNPANKNQFIGFYGDLDRVTPTFYECKFMSHEYDPDTGLWSTTLIKEDTFTSRYKGAPGSFYNGELYWGADTGTAGQRGLWKSPLAGIDNPANHTQVFNSANPTALLNGFLSYDGTILLSTYSYIGSESHSFGEFATPNIIWSDDLVTFNEVLLKVPGNSFAQKITKVAHKKYQLDLISDYFYFKGARSLIVQFD